jgi:hypothetical protein
MRYDAAEFIWSPLALWVGDLGPVVLATSLFMVGTQANLLERSAIGSKPVGRDPSGSEALLPEQLGMSLQAAALFRRRWIRTSKTSPSSSTARHRYICLPAIRTTISSRYQRELGLGAQLPQVPGNRRSERAHPAPDRLVRDIQPPLGQQILGPLGNAPGGTSR